MPVDDFQNLTLKDFPSVQSGNLPEAVLWNDKIFVLSPLSQMVPFGPDILEYDMRGNLLAYTDKSILECSPNDIANIDDYLFISCMNVGVYKIDLVENQVVSFYNETNGLNNTQNLQLSADEGTLWVGTFKGLGKIDIKTDKVEFYGSELGGNCSDEPTIRVFAKNGEVWVTIIAHANCAGGASRYDSANDQWTFYSAEAFDQKNSERIDFGQFIISDDGVYAVYQDGGPDFETLSKFNAEKGTWEIVYQAPYVDFNSNLSEYLPPRETYSFVDVDENYRETKSVEIYTSKWIEVPLPVKEYVDLALIDDTYYLLSNEGLDLFTRDDKLPISIAKSDSLFSMNKSKLFSAVDADKNYIGFFSIDYSEMSGDNYAYGVGVYNIQDKTFFDDKLVMDDLLEVFGENSPSLGVDFENLEFVHGSGEVKIEAEGGEFVIDLINEEFFARET
ncbi:hypothetical protein HN709_03250 [Candidatus Peregrinibacteria bacterium]|nr:hypothetical protein [Candidatus Peregrinibacteria bacterium]